MASSPSPRRRPNTNRNPQINPSNWRSWLDLQVTIRNLPIDVTIAELGSWFSQEGEISWINIRAGNEASGKTTASVRFEPPPKRAFWERSPYIIRHPNHDKHPHGLRVYIEVTGDAWNNDWVVSPVSPARRYPKRVRLPLSCLQFGSMVGTRRMLVMKEVKAFNGVPDLQLEVELNFKRATVYFPMPVQVRDRRISCNFKLEFDLGDMKHVYVNSALQPDWALTIPLPTPPRYYWKPTQVQPTSSDSYRWSERDSWHRISDICEDRDAPLKCPVALFNDIPEPGYMEIGRWTTFRLVLKDNKRGQVEDVRLAQDLLMAFKDFNVSVEISDDLKVEHNTNKQIWMFSDSLSAATTDDALALLGNQHPRLTFEVRYQLEVCISQRLLNEYSISREFLARLAALEPMNARLRLEYLADQNTPLLNPMTLLDNPEAEYYFPNGRTPHYCALVRKVNITPTTMRLNTPTVETSNRILRRYNDVQDRFLRVQFVNEAQSNVISRNENDNDNYEDVWNRVLRTFYQGITIGDRRYEFLAYGSSQLRQCGAYFFAPTEHLSCDDIRQWMGSFGHIRVVAKYAARVGQCFSTTRQVRGLSTPSLHLIEDIERNGYCFTDGVGIISSLLATIIIEEMDLDVAYQPTVFQFRMGGYKGLLAVWPQAKGTEIHARKSQQKFLSSYNGLEVVRCAKFATATLNQQTIIILESLGVPIKNFVKLAEEQLQAHTEALTDNQVAIDLLTKFVDENQNTLVLAQLLAAGFRSKDVQEPFVINMINLWHAWSLKLLKEKSRLHVEKSAFLFGCVDETGTLRGHSRETEGSRLKDINQLPQIFLQITDPKRFDKTNIIKGVCIVGRNPSLHPGDIRVAQAVDNPLLHHLKDVAVFPSTGDRPLPSMLSGGDLDGDDFFVMWDPELIPAEWNHPPMDYTATSPVELDRDVNVNDMRNFFIQYMKLDKLGLIAIAHKGQADRHGPKSEICLELARLHSKAVDFPKTGHPAEFDKAKLQPRAWPHFMEKGNKYNSTKALGEVYNKVAQQPMQFSPDWEHVFDQRITTRYELNDEILAKARGIKAQYDISVRRILTQQSLQTEFELWSGFTMSRAVGTTNYKRQEDLGREYDVLKHRYRELCYDAAGGKEAEQIDPFVAAIYKVTEEEYVLALNEQRKERAEGCDGESTSMPLISFAWIFHWVLIRIALGDKYTNMKSVLAGARRRR